MGLIEVRLKSTNSCFYHGNPASQDFFLVWNQDCELVSQLPYYFLTKFLSFVKNGADKLLISPISCHSIYEQEIL